MSEDFSATTNGTKVKGQKIRWAALLPDDKISLGSVKFRVYLGPDNVPSPSEQAPPVLSSSGTKLSFPPAPAPARPAATSASRTAPAPQKSVLFPSDDELPIILDDEDEDEIIELD